MIAEKANDLINLARETLGADFLLPHFVNILNGMAQDVNQLKTKISALEVLIILIKDSDSLQMQTEDSYIQFAAVIKTLGNIIKLHTSHKGVIAPVVTALASLRDKNQQITFKAIQEELSHTQYVILKQILNTQDKVLSQQLLEYQKQINFGGDSQNHNNFGDEFMQNTVSKYEKNLNSYQQHLNDKSIRKSSQNSGVISQGRGDSVKSGLIISK